MEPGTKLNLLEQLTARRQNYRRSQTVASLPVFESSDLKQLSSGGSHKTGTKLPGEIDDRDLEFRPRGRSPEEAEGHLKPCENRSISPWATQRGLCQAFLCRAGEKPPRQLPTKRVLGRTPSSPSILLSKVRERIREKVIETSVEWPSMAAIVQERRQKAASAFEAQLSQAHAEVCDENDARKAKSNNTKLLVKKVLGQSRSTSGEIIPRKETSKLQLRRRSISMDTFDRIQMTNGDKRPLSNGAEPGGRGEGGRRGGGVVCTKDDFKSIVNSFRKEVSADKAGVVSVSDRNTVLTQKSASDVNQISNQVSSGSHLDYCNCTESSKNPPSNSSGAPLSRCRNATFTGPFNEAATSETSCTDRKQSNRSETKFSRSDVPLFRSSSAKATSSATRVKLLAASTHTRHASVRKSASVTSTSTLNKNNSLSRGSPRNSIERLLPTATQPNSSIREKVVTCLLGDLSRRVPHCRSKQEFPSPFGKSVNSRERKSDSRPDVNCPHNDLFDPVILGQAIEGHLEAIMRTRASGESPFLVNK